MYHRGSFTELIVVKTELNVVNGKAGSDVLDTILIDHCHLLSDYLPRV